MSENGQEIRDRISNEYEKTPGYLIYDLTEAVGQVMDEMDADLAAVDAKFDIENLTGEELERFVSQRKGVSRRAATYAKGMVTVTGTGTVNQGDIFETPNGVQFAADETVQIVNTGEVPVTALVPGNTGMVGAGSITQMPVTIAGINACTNAEPTHDGYDAETDEALRERYLLILRNPPGSSNKAAYKTWALEVSGVGDAEVFPLAKGDNTVDVVIIDTDKKPASELLVQQVQEYIDPESSGKGEGVAPMGAHCYVSAATGLDINITAKLTVNGDHATIEQAIKDSIETYLASIAFTDANVSYAQVGNYILDVEGVLDYEQLTVNSGTGNISVPERSVAILGTAVFTYAEQ